MAATISVSESACGRLVRREFTQHELPSLIEAIFAGKDASDTIRCLLGDDAQTFIDVIDEVLDSPGGLSPCARKKCLKSLYRTCGRLALLPRALKISVYYDRTSVASYRGRYADVWKGKHCDRDVAVKVIRVYSNSDLQKIIGRFCKEVVAWKTLRHPNVLSLIGVTMSENQFAMISDWMMNGNINNFLKVHPNTNRLGLLGDVSRGLIYIHSQGMIHGDLKGANILIDQTGHARLANFGLLTIISDPSNLLSSSSCTQGGTVRWMSPERIAPERFGLENGHPTKSSDCYALGMVIYETISGNLPFHRHSDFTVSLKVMEDVGTVLDVSTQQPSGHRRRSSLEMLSNSSESSPPVVDEEMDEDSGDSDSANSSSCVLNGTSDTATEIPGVHPGRQPAVEIDGGGVGSLVHRNQQQQAHIPGFTFGADTDEAIYRRLIANINKYAPNPQKFPSGTCIPQRPYCQGTAIPESAVGQSIVFAIADGKCFPAELALARQCDRLVDGGGVVFSEQNHTINLRIEWPGYNGWGTQIRTVDYQEQPKGITRVKLVTEIAKQLEKFIERMQPAGIHPSFAEYKVGPGGI